jgi:predicted ATP-grasp superfamily ATP-dependent carboligase
MAGIAPLLGNPPEVVRRTKDPEGFFPLLERLGVPHPETLTVAPPGFDGPGWLFKQIGGAGGAHVRPARGPCPPGHYLQRERPGRPHSAVFLADGRRARVLSYNAIRVQGGTGSARFRYSGAVTIPPPPMAPDLEAAIDALVPALGLVGLCGLDFLLDGDGAYAVLELNPRPTATFELYEDLHEDGPWPFALHLAACHGRLPRGARLCRSGIATHAVLWAQETLRVPGDLLWPDWARDRPVAGTLIHPGDPICTVHARAARRHAVEALLAERQTRLGAALARPLAA